MKNTFYKTNKLTVMTVVGTRPEIIKLSRTIDKLDQYSNHILVHTGQNFDYELNQIFFDELEIPAPDVFLGCAGRTAADTISQVIARVDSMYEKFSPDAILILGDTNSSMAAIPAKKRQIPIFHMEAGNRCFDLRVPEEVNRKIVDHVSDVNMPYSDIAREYLLREGISPELIVKTGSPMNEVIDHYRTGIENSNILVKMNLVDQNYFVVSAHRQENVDSNKILHEFVSILNNIASAYEMPIIVSTHPRTRNRIDELQLRFDPLVQLHKPLGFLDYVSLQVRSKAVLSDSGTITEESSILNFPALNIRSVHERPEGMEEGAVMFTGMNRDRILRGLKLLEFQGRGKNRTFEKVSDYCAPNVSDKVVRTIFSYTDYVNEYVWRKE